MRSQKRLAAELMKVGINRIRTVPSAKEEIAMAITREDVRKLIHKGFIYALPVDSTSRGRIRHRKAQKKKGRRKGHGKRKGKKTARAPRKRQWIKRVRALRRELSNLKKDGKIDSSTYRKFYRNIKSGTIQSRAHLLGLIEEK